MNPMVRAARRAGTAIGTRLPERARMAETWATVRSGLKIVRAVHDVAKTPSIGAFAKTLRVLSMVDAVSKEMGNKTNPLTLLTSQYGLVPDHNRLLLQAILPFIQKEFAWSEIHTGEDDDKKTPYKIGRRGNDVLIVRSFHGWRGSLEYESPWFRSSDLTPDILLESVWETSHVFLQFNGQYSSDPIKVRPIAPSPDPVAGHEYTDKFHEVCKVLERDPTGTAFIGKPGTGKTQCILHAAATTGKKVLNVQVDQGVEYTTQLTDIFEQLRPDILFLDDVDHIPQKGLFQLLDSLRKLPVHLVIAANKPEVLDEAIWRPGRIEHLFEFNLPDASERKSILDRYGEIFEVPIPDSFLPASDGYSGAFLREMVRRLTFETPERAISQIEMLRKMRPSQTVKKAE